MWSGKIGAIVAIRDADHLNSFAFHAEHRIIAQGQRQATSIRSILWKQIVS